MAYDKSNQPPDHPLFRLDRAELDLILELVLQSGSLKGLAGVYGVSYPTIRARLNRVIRRLQEAVAGHDPDPLTELLARLVERGEITPAAARAVRDLVRQLALPRADAAPQAPRLDAPEEVSHA